MTVKLLLDEQLPRQIAQLFPDSWDIKTVQQMGWQGTSNGALLNKAIGAGFVAMLTSDKNIEYQQNPQKLKLPIIVLHAKTTRLQDLEIFGPQVIALLTSELEPTIYNLTEHL